MASVFCAQSIVELGKSGLTSLNADVVTVPGGFFDRRAENLSIILSWKDETQTASRG